MSDVIAAFNLPGVAEDIPLRTLWLFLGLLLLTGLASMAFQRRNHAGVDGNHADAHGHHDQRFHHAFEAVVGQHDAKHDEPDARAGDEGRLQKKRKNTGEKLGDLVHAPSS